MRLSHIFSLSFAHLRARKARTILTILALGVGIGAIVFLVSLGFGLHRLVLDRVTSLEAMTVIDVTKGTSLVLKMDEDVLESFRNIPHVKTVSPSLNVPGQVILEDTATDVACYAIDPNFLNLEGLRIVSGKNIQNEKEILLSSAALDLLGRSKEEILDKEVKLRLFVHVLGEEGRTEEVEVQVKGVIEDAESLAYVPLPLASSLGLSNYNLVRLKVEAEKYMPEIRSQVESLGFATASVRDTVEQIDRVFAIFQWVVAGLGFLATFIAAMGAFNTLTVSLLERTREIGMMRALGTSRGDIYKMFLCDAFILGIFGGICGLGIGLGVGELCNFIVNRLALGFGGEMIDIFYSPLGFLGIIIGFSILLSFFTGFYPARRASKIEPLEVLRYG